MPANSQILSVYAPRYPSQPEADEAARRLADRFSRPYFVYHTEAGHWLVTPKEPDFSCFAIWLPSVSPLCLTGHLGDC